MSIDRFGAAPSRGFVQELHAPCLESSIVAPVVAQSSAGFWQKIERANELAPILEPGDFVFLDSTSPISMRDMVRIDLTNGKVIWRIVIDTPEGISHKGYWGLCTRTYRHLTYASDRVRAIVRITGMLRFRRDPAQPLVTLPWANLQSPGCFGGSPWGNAAVE